MERNMRITTCNLGDSVCLTTFRGQSLPLDVQNDIKRLESNGFIPAKSGARTVIAWKNGMVRVHYFCEAEEWQVMLLDASKESKPFHRLRDAFDDLRMYGVIDIFCRQMWPDDEEEPNEDFDKDGAVMDIDAILGKNEKAEKRNEKEDEPMNEDKQVLKCGTCIQGLDSITYNRICEDYGFLEMNGFKMCLAVPGSPVYWQKGSIELELGTDYKWRGHELRHKIYGEASDDVDTVLKSLHTKLKDWRDKMFSEPLSILDGCRNNTVG